MVEGTLAARECYVLYKNGVNAYKTCVRNVLDVMVLPKLALMLRLLNASPRDDFDSVACRGLGLTCLKVRRALVYR